MSGGVPTNVGSDVGEGASRAYPQQVNLDAAKAEAAQIQSEASKQNGGQVPKGHPASAARVSALDSLLKLELSILHKCRSCVLTSFVC